MVQLVGFDIFGSTVEAFANRNGLQRAQQMTSSWTLSGPIETATSKLDPRDNILFFGLLLKRLPAAWNALMYARLYHPLSSLSLSFVLSSLMSSKCSK